MYCQACGFLNADDREICARCQQKLLVLSGGGVESAAEFDLEADEEGFSFDEHLLERISVLEEAVKRTAETLSQVLGAIHKQERAILVNQTGLSSLRELLESKGQVGRDEWSDLWESKMEFQMLALEKRDRFVAIKDRMAALYDGEERLAFERLLEGAEFALYAFELDGAIRSLEMAHKLDPGNPELNFFLGETCFNDGRPAEALPYLERVLEAEPEHYEGLVYSGVIHHEAGDHRRAASALERAVELYPDSFLAHFSLGAVRAEEGDDARAVELLERAVEIDPVPQALFLLGSKLYEMGRTQKAIRALERTVRHDPGHEEAFHLLGMARLDRGWRRQALEAFQQALALNPKKLRYLDLVNFLTGPSDAPLPQVGAGARRRLERADAARGDAPPERVLELYREAIEAAPDNPTVLLTYALTCLELGGFPEAERIARRILDLGPGERLEATAAATLMEALRAEGRHEEGNAVGERLLESAESDFARAVACYELAFNLAEMEVDLDRALELAHRALELVPDELRQFPLDAVGWVHFKRREPDDAVDYLQRASELGPSASTLRHLGLALLDSGAEEAAREVLAEAGRADDRGASVERKMMDLLQSSTRLRAKVQRGHGSE